MAKGKKAKQGKKTHSNIIEYERFNETSYKNSQKLRKLLVSSLNEVAEKYKARPISLRQRDFDGSFFDREWSWQADFFRKYLNYVESTHREWPERYWLDCLVRQCGIMVWNLTNKTIMMEYKNGGKWPGGDKLPRKKRGAESVAEHFANIEEQEFFQNFK